MVLIVSEEDFKSFSPLLVYGNSRSPGWGQFGPLGLDWQDLCRGPLDIAIYLIVGDY